MSQSVRERGREGGVTSGLVRQHRIIERVGNLPIDQRVLTAYKQGYDAGYHAALKRMNRKAAC